MSIAVHPYGQLPDGREVQQYELSNSQGLVLKVINYGGIITELHVPDRDGKLEDVVLGLPSLEKYLAGHPWFGAITGRVAGRITSGKFTLDGTDYELELNDPPNHLHSGAGSLDKQFWEGETQETVSGEAQVKFTYLSPEGECGYPGNVQISVTYTLTDKNEVQIDYRATTDRATPLSLTNHSYFNLAGEGNGTVADHLIQIHADEYAPTSDEMTLLGRTEPVIGKPNDFIEPVRLGDRIDGLLENHGDNYMVRREDTTSVVPVARVEDPASGRIMEVESTENCVQFYTGKFLDEAEVVGKCGKEYVPHDALCLECQGYPDGVNSPEIQDIILKPGQIYQQQTIYRFLAA